MHAEKHQEFFDHQARNNGSAPRRDVYYNPRLDPKNFLDGPLSTNPATRLRQMLARPGIVVRKMTFEGFLALMTLS